MMFVYITFDPCIIRRIADIDHSLHDVIQSGVRFFQQGFDILDHAGSLFYDIASMHDFSVSVDACRAGDKDMAAVAVCDSCAPFKRNAVFICAVQVFWCI